MTPVEALEAAQRLLERPSGKTAGLWPRAAALLARQALEESIDEYWKSKGVDLGACAMRPQLLCLPRYLDDEELALDVGHAWGALTRACHHHPYELPPTAPELSRWMATTRRLIECRR